MFVFYIGKAFEDDEDERGVLSPRYHDPLVERAEALGITLSTANILAGRFLND